MRSTWSKDGWRSRIDNGKLVMTQTAKIPAAELPEEASRSMRNLSLLLLTPLAAARTSMAPPAQRPPTTCSPEALAPLRRPGRATSDRARA